MDPAAAPVSAFDPLGLAGLHLASILARHGDSAVIVGEFQRAKQGLRNFCATSHLPSRSRRRSILSQAR